MTLHNSTYASLTILYPSNIVWKMLQNFCFIFSSSTCGSNVPEIRPWTTPILAMSATSSCRSSSSSFELITTSSSSVSTSSWNYIIGKGKVKTALCLWIAKVNGLNGEAAAYSLAIQTIQSHHPDLSFLAPYSLAIQTVQSHHPDLTERWIWTGQMGRLPICPIQFHHSDHSVCGPIQIETFPTYIYLNRHKLLEKFLRLS